MKRKLLMCALALSVFIGVAPVKAIAEDGLCDHHTEHTPECGYEEGSEHTHTEACYELVEKCTHEHGEECYIKTEDSEEKILDCKHECSEESACINTVLICTEETKEAKECTFECKVCATQKRIDALHLEEIKVMSDEEKAAVKAEMNAIYASMDALSEEEKMSLKLDSLKAVEEYFLSGEETTETLIEPQVQEDEPTLVADLPYETIGREELLKNHTVKTASPEHVKINMFDYWLHERNSTDNGEVNAEDVDAPASEIDTNGNGKYDKTEQTDRNKTVSKWEAEAFYHGINVGHALIFHSNLDFGGPGDSVITFNRWTQSTGAAYANIVSPRLNEDEFPVLNYPNDENGEPHEEIKNAFAKVYPGIVDKYPDGTESLSYLFDPNTENEYRASFEDVKGLLQIDEYGHYYYDSKKNFAELLEDEKCFAVYEAPAVKKDTMEGQFFPFNHGEDVFVKDKNGKLDGFENRELYGEKYVTQANAMNHYFGMTMEATFYQPAGGLISNTQNKEKMVFEFVGDDDVWIFIDGVLVADLGGNHDPLKTTINFATGEVVIDREDENHNKKIVTTIREQFVKAGAEKDVDFKGNTFADNTVHEFKMFYLERGNNASNLRVSFNLLEPNYGELTKMNQDGKPLEGIGFYLYEADENFQPKPNPIAHLITDEQGNARFVKDGTDQSLSFREGNYLLRETAMIPGYVRTGDLKLTYSENTQVFKVVNAWETGANGGFKVEFLQAGSLHTIRYDSQGKEIKEEVDETTAREGLILMVPMLNDEAKGMQTTEGWQPLYGSKTEGFHLVEVGDYEGDMNVVYQRASLEAALRHVANPNNEAWYLEYNEDLDRFESRVEALPGSADRYVFLNPTDGDLVSTYYLLHVGDSDMKDLTTGQKIEMLRNYLNAGGEEEVEDRIQELVNAYYGNMELLDIDDFNRLFFPQLFIPNQAREVRVLKQDENNNPLQGAVFALFEDEGCTKEVARGITNEEGRISFSIENEGNNATNGGELSSNVKVALARIREKDGTVKDRSYYLKEVKAPEGYALNTAVTEIRLTEDDLLINTGSKDNGVSVLRGLRKLVRSMIAYASDGKIDATLRDIIATKRTYDENVKGEQLPSLDTWEVNKGEEPLNLHFGLDTALIEYGLHDKDRKPYFMEEEGWITLDVKQNYEAHMDEEGEDKIKKTDIRDKDISALFTGTFTIVVTNQRSKGDLNIAKTVGGNEGEREKDFTFEITLMEDGKPHNGTYLYVGGGQDDIQKPKDGQLVFKDGKATITLKHGQSITIKDIPSLLSYTVVEEEADQNGYVTSKVGETGVIEEKVIKKAEFTNIKEVKYGGIVVNKIVSGNAGDSSRDFTFRLILDDRSVNGKRGDFFFVNGVAEFTLKHGEKKACNKLPDGINYRVEEYGADDYTVTSKNEVGSIEADSIKEVHFNNYKTKNDKPTDEKPTDEKPKFPVVNTSVK